MDVELCDPPKFILAHLHKDIFLANKAASLPTWKLVWVACRGLLPSLPLSQ